MHRLATIVAALLLLMAAVPPADAQTVSGVEPSSPYPGHPVTISGSGFSNNTSNVSYNGTSVAYRVVSDSEIRARVPTGATTDASFAVTTDGGTATSATLSLDTDAPYGPERGLTLDGNGDYVATGVGGDDLGLVNESFSVDVWLKVASIPGSGQDGIVAMDGSGDYTTLHLTVTNGGSDPGGGVKFAFFGDDLTAPDGTITTGTWTHLTFVYDAVGGNRYIYKNGEQIVSDTPSDDFQGTKEVLIGRYAGGNYLDGEIDQVRVWSGALTTAEIRERARRTIGPGDAAFSELEAAYRFDASGSGSPAYETSDSYRFGTFQGDASRTTFSGARLGQESAVATNGSSATVGPSGGQLTAANVSSGDAVQVYRFGEIDSPARDGSAAGDDLSSTPARKRSNLTWGVATVGSPSADLTIDYSGVQNVSAPVTLLRRDGPGQAWARSSGWTHDEAAQTFTNSGSVQGGQYAVASLPAQVYVDDDNTSGPQDGTSWETAYPDLQTAIDNAASVTEIWIAEGIYKPDSEGDSFTITGNKDGIALYGGFDGTESSRSAREPKTHRTILSGDRNGDDTDPDNDGIIEDADPNQDGTPENLNGDENAHHVLVLDGGNGIGSDVSANVTSATVIDGMVVTAGQADGSGPDENGGGLYCDGNGSGNECSPTLRGVIFAGNAASDKGGAIYNDGDGGTASPQISNAAFVGNAASGRHGGAVYNNGFGGTSSPSITNTAFAENGAAESGGAIYNDGREGGVSSPSITNCTLTGNTASINGGAIYNDGSQESLQGGTATPTLANTILWGNVADADGDGSGSGSEIYNETGRSGGTASATLTHTIIEGGVNGSGVGGDSNTDNGGNLDQDPRFANPSSPAGPDGTFATVDDGLNVTAGSPAFDAGDNAAIPSGVTTDITGVDRTQDGDGDGTETVNIGAYEVAFEGPPLATAGSATGIGATSADLPGTVNPRGNPTTVRAEFFPTSAPSDVQTVTDSDGPFTGGAVQSITVSINGLTPNTEYKARILANNAEGGDQSKYVTFTTAAGYTRTITGTDGTGNDAGWRMLALPVQGKTRAALEDDLTFSTNSGSILYDWISGAWSPLENSSDALPRGTGFMLYFFDDVIDPIDSDGLPLAVGTGSEDQSVDKTVDGLSTGETFHLLGNPFDVAFDLSELNLSGQGFQQTVQIWDPASESYTAVTQAGDQSDVIGAWQGFFVERDPNAPTDGTSLTFSTAGKQSGPGTIIGGQSAAVADAKRNDEQRLRLGLRLAVTDTTEGDTEPPSPDAQAAPTREVSDSINAEAATQSSDAAQVDTVGTGRLGLLLSSEATGGWDAYEASRLGPPGGGEAPAALSSPLKRGGDETPVQRALASEPYPGESAAVTLPVSVQTNGAGGRATIRLSETQRERVPSGWSVRLTDTKTGEQADLLDESYRFAPREGEGTELQSPPESRFRLAVGPTGALPVTDGLTLEAPYPNPASGQVTVEYAVPKTKARSAQLQLYDVLGRRVRTAPVKPGPRTRRLDVSGLASGVYVLRLVADGVQQTRKLTVVR